MKFRDYLFAPGVRPLSIGFGCLIGSAVAVFSDLVHGAFVGAVTVLFASFAIPLAVFLQELPYNRIKKEMQGPFVFDERVQFTLKGGNVSGYFILTDHRMIFLSLERGLHRMELSREDVRDIRSDERYSIRIYLNEKEFIQVRSPLSEEMLRVLSEKGWG